MVLLCCSSEILTLFELLRSKRARGESCPLILATGRKEERPQGAETCRQRRGVPPCPAGLCSICAEFYIEAQGFKWRGQRSCTRVCLHVTGSLQEAVNESADGALSHSGTGMLAPSSAFVFHC